HSRLSVCSSFVCAVAALAARARARARARQGCGGADYQGEGKGGQSMRSFSPVSGERRHRVDPGKTVEEARSGPGGGGRPSCREGAGGVVRASAAVRGCSNRPPQRRWRRRDPGPAASTVPFVALGGGGFLERPVSALGVLLLVLSLTGLAGALCLASCLLWLFLLILLLFAFTVFAFVVTNRGAGWVVSGRGYKEYRLGDYSTWMQRRVEDSQNWAKIRSCLQDGEVCQKLTARKETVAQFVNSNLSPMQVELQVFRKELDRSESFTVSIPAHTGGAMPASSYSDQSLTGS
ncbi:uncharacterized protein, partial [Miscanthus floridulus]|uniref:uncharacterized protein n=1 Tax=Miscanthus floridulus TaxID=154761 RepID=UPI00345A7820